MNNSENHSENNVQDNLENNSDSTNFEKKPVKKKKSFQPLSLFTLSKIANVKLIQNLRNFYESLKCPHVVFMVREAFLYNFQIPQRTLFENMLPTYSW